MQKCGLLLTKQTQVFTNSEFEKINLFKYYNYNEVALLSIGIWSSHSCYSATERIHNLAEHANTFIEKMRSKGCHIIHGGSYSNYSCKTGNWEDSQLRKNIKGMATAKLIDHGTHFPPLPIDDSDGGYDKSDKNLEYNKKTITIHPKISVDYEKDCISDYSKEILNYLYAKKIKCILVFGTHTNMCILDKPYGIKWYIRYGFPVVIVRDLLLRPPMRCATRCFCRLQTRTATPSTTPSHTPSPSVTASLTPTMTVTGSGTAGASVTPSVTGSASSTTR